MKRDKLYEIAKEIVIKTQKASAANLQRRLRIGYTHSTRLLDQLEKAGIVGKCDGKYVIEIDYEK